MSNITIKSLKQQVFITFFYILQFFYVKAFSPFVQNKRRFIFGTEVHAGLHVSSM